MDKLDDLFDNINILNKSLSTYVKNKEKIKQELRNLNGLEEELLEILLKRMKEINLDIYELNNKIETLQYEIDINRLEEIDEDTNERILEYERIDKMEKIFLPYYLLYYLYSKNI